MSAQIYGVIIYYIGCRNKR